MTQRNPMNERYQETDDKKLGKTRKSAASAKPATKAASSVYVSDSKAPKPKGRMAKAASQAKREETSGKSAKAHSPQERAKYYDPGTPEYKLWRRVYWGTIIAALVFTALSFAVMQFWPDNTALSITMLVLAYGGLIAGILVDILKVRKIRKKYTDKKISANSKKARAEEKARKAEEQQRAEAQAAEEAKKAAERQAKKGSLMGRFGFGKKTEDGAAGDAQKDAEAAEDAAEKAADAKPDADAATEKAANVKTESAEPAGK